MSWPHASMGWDDTIRPGRHHGLSHRFNTLSLSPENKRKRRHEDTATVTPPNTPNSASTNTKRSRISVANSRLKTGQPISLRRRLDALDRQQLVALVEDLVDQQPDLASTMEKLVPNVTAQQALVVLRGYQAEIRRLIPLGDPQGDYAFLRVRPQWTSFFVALADYTVSFLEMDTVDIGKVLEFLDGATSLVHESPRWTTPANNQLLSRAYSELEQAWIQTLERSNGSSPFAVMAGAAWDSRFHAHCEKSRGAMTDNRNREVPVQVVPRCEGVTS